MTRVIPKAVNAKIFENLIMRKVISCFFLILLVGVPTIVNAKAAPQLDEEVLQGFVELNEYINSIGDDVLNKGQRNSFLSKVAAAENAYRRGQICTAYNQMNAYLHSAQALRRSGRMAIGEDLYNRGRALRDSFFDVFTANPNLAPPRCYESAMEAKPQLTIEASNNKHFAASLSFGTASMWSVEAGGELFTELELPGLPALGGVPGLPGIPTWRALLAVPKGALANLSMILPPVISESLQINLYPYQSEPADQLLSPIDPAFANTPFVKNENVYTADAFFPTSPCSITPLGQYRDLQVVQVLCSSGQYNPVTDELRLFKGVSFDVAFDGGDGNFITTQTMSPFETSSSSVIGSVLNKSVVAEYVQHVDISPLVCLGEELLILTHPDFRAAADTLAQWKEDKGIVTTVINVGAGTSYVTADQIDDLIENRYDNCQVRPSYVLIMGDVEFVPPARTDYNTNSDDSTGSDWGYALYPQSFLDVFFPDFGVGRISVDTADEAQRVVDKIIKYESDPPFIDFASGGPFYTTAALAAQFQCCRMNQDGSPLDGQNGRAQRSFAETAEIVRNALMAAGKTGERIYVGTVDNGGYCLVNQNPCPAGQLQQPYTGNTTPNRYYNGSLLPTDLRSGSGFMWNGSTLDIINAFNEGRFLVLHRDHGSSSGFSHPSFTTGNLSSLHNDELLPVVYSVNCASGFFDRETDSGSSSESFMEQLLLEPDGGMVGGLGDVRNSPTWANSALTRGFFDATWPNLAPEYGTSTSKRRLADILNHGKVYMLTQVGVAQTAGSVSLEQAIEEYIIWHAYGDPTLEMWTRNPHRFLLSREYQLQAMPEYLRVLYAEEGAEITALQRTKQGIIPIGRAVVSSGVAQIPYFHQPESGTPIMLSASKENAVSVLLTPGGPGTQPDLVVRDLILASTTLHPGDDLSTLLGVKVGNLGGAVADGTVNTDGSTKEGYMIDLVLSSDTSMPSGFATLPQPEGVAYTEDGLLDGGRISRTPDVPATTDLELSTSPPISSDIGGIIPLQVPLGNMYLCARVDPGEEVTESDETNNVFCRQVTIEPASR
jgi:hypothetical protein